MGASEPGWLLVVPQGLGTINREVGNESQREDVLSEGSCRNPRGVARLGHAAHPGQQAESDPVPPHGWPGKELHLADSIFVFVRFHVREPDLNEIPAISRAYRIECPHHRRLGSTPPPRHHML